MATLSIPKVPKAFIWRRLHSLMGLWFVLFLIEHLLTNSQAALWLGDNGKGFVRMVNALHNLPYLQAIEIFLLGVPILLHIVLGVKYLLTSKSNVLKGDGSKPYIPRARNYAYTLQRITSWILLVGVILHVYKFRFMEYPESIHVGATTFYMVKVDVDPGLYTVAERWNVALLDQAAIEREKEALLDTPAGKELVQEAYALRKQAAHAEAYDPHKEQLLQAAQTYEEQERWVAQLQKESLRPHQVLAASPDFGTATLLTVRDAFKQPIYLVLYTIFVLAACFHAFNGFWTFLISWGWVLKMAAQRAWVGVSVALMLVMIFLGLAAIWGTYWFNLRF